MRSSSAVVVAGLSLLSLASFLNLGCESTAGDEGEGDASDGGEGDAGDEGEGDAGDEGEGDAGDEGEGDAGDEGEGDGDVEVETPVLVINEVQNSGGDLVEVTNVGGDSAFASDGFYVTDDLEDAGHRAAVDVEVGVGALVVVDVAAAGFGIAAGEDVYLVKDGVVVDHVVAGAVVAGANVGRVPDGRGEFVDVTPSPGAPNAAYVDPSDALFDAFGDSVRIDLSLPPASEESLRTDGYTYVEGTFTLTAVRDGVTTTTGPLTVGLRKKGRIGSFRDFSQKMAWKVDFNRFVDGQTLFGLGKLNLNNLVQDSSTVHELMAYEVFRAEGVPSPRTGWARVFVDGVEFGTYLTIEATDDKAFLQRNFASTQAVFEGEYGEDLFDGSAGNFDPDVGSDGDPAAQQALADLVSATNGAPTDQFFATLDPIVDWDEVLSQMATEVFIGHWDGYAPTRNNYYLHLDDDGVWRMMPWGVDQTFDYDWPLYEGQGLLLQRCLADTACRPLWEEKLLQIADDAEALLAAGFDDDVRVLAALNLTRFADDPRREWDNNNIPALADNAIAFLERRIADVRDQLACTRDPDADVDGDGFACSLDCDEGDAASHFGAAEVCDDHKDQDCNGRLDDGGDCRDCVPDVTQPAQGVGRPLLFCRAPMTYADSVARCEANGMRLVSLVDDADNEAVYAVAYTWFGEQSYWIGFDDRDTEGRFDWSDGRSWQLGADRPFTRWAGGEPNDAGGNEDCGHVWGFDSSWNDIPCDVSFSAVCE